jgi:hypothetical protein
MLEPGYPTPTAVSLQKGGLHQILRGRRLPGEDERIPLEHAAMTGDVVVEVQPVRPAGHAGLRLITVQRWSGTQC